jgi:putative ABC transport system permease protein
LFIACVNVAGLLLVKAIRCQREYAVRLALGSSPSAIIRESILEGLLLSMTGGLLGLAFAAVAIRTALHLLPESMPRVASISLDFAVAAFALGIALITGVVCSLAPAFAALRTNLPESLKDGARAGTSSSSHSRLRSALVVSEIAIAVVLITVSGAFLRSFQKMQSVDPGFRPDQVFAVGYQLPIQQYSTDASADLFNRAVIDRLSSKPGVSAVGITYWLPASGLLGQSAYTIESMPAEQWKLQFAGFAGTYGDYFKALGISLVEGRYFTMDDRANTPLVAIVNQSMAKHSWPGQSAIGKRMHMGNPKKGTPWATVVGVVANTKVGGRDDSTMDQWYFPMQQPAILYGQDYNGKLTSSVNGYIAMRSSLPTQEMTQMLRATIAEIDPLLALRQVQTMNEVLASAEAPRRFNTDLITAFAISALLLAIIGIYAVVAFSVSLRMQELAIRVALGSQRTGIARIVFTSAAKLALLGCALGVAGSLAASRLVSSFLFEVSATDPIIYMGAVLVMMLMAVLASVLPAMRAASANPIEALRTI